MANLSEQLSTLNNRVSGLQNLITGMRTTPLVYAALGETVLFGCKVTQGESAADYIIALEGLATGDEDHLNPDYSADPLYPFQVANIASCKAAAFYSADLTATMEQPPVTDSGRYDIAYIAVGPTGPVFSTVVGEPSEAVKTDFDTNGLRTTAYDPMTDAALPVGAIPVARIYVEDDVTGIPNSRIADIRNFLSRLQGEQGPAGPAGRDTVYIAYASDDTGTDFTTTFNPALNYIAVLTSDVELDPPVASDFNGLWFNYKGEQGIQGDAGDSAYVYIAYASDDTGTDFTLTFNSALNYIAVLTTSVEIPSPVVGDFAGLWKNYKGETGEQGESAFVYIAYASDNTGTDFTLTFNPALNYIAILSTTVEIPSPAVGDFSGLWFNYKGETGNNGLDGDNAYLYLAYASDDSGTGFTLTFNPALDYIAALSTDTEIVTPVAGDFTGLWKKYKGETGDGLQIDAIGTFAGRDTYDDEPADFVYLSTDGDGDTVTGTTLFVKLSATSGDWSVGAPFEGDSAYVYIAYASDDTGTGFTLTFNSALNYIAIKATTVEIASPVAGDFTGLWKNYKGESGTNGTNGTNGTDGDSAYVYIAYASDDTGTDFTLTFNDSLAYIAILATDTEIVTPVVGDFTGLWKNYQGPTVYPGAGIAVSTGSAWGTSKTAPSGDLVGTTDAQTLSAKSFVDTKTQSSVVTAKGSVSSGTVTFSLLDGTVQSLTVGGALTIAIDDKPTAAWELEVILTDGGAFAVTMPTVSWLLGDGTTSTTFADMGVTLAASGVNTLLFWGVGAGTVYGRAG